MVPAGTSRTGGPFGHGPYTTTVNEIVWEFSQSAGSVSVKTDVAGRAARTGHRLTLEMREWSAAVTMHGRVPVALRATVAVGSLEVTAAQGGVTPMTGAEKSLARTNALRSLNAERYPEILYEADTITATDDGFGVDGRLTIHGRTRAHRLDLRVEETEDRWRITAETPVVQTDFGVKPYSLLMGTLKVADEVRVRIDVHRVR